jgi:hypothetical protein
VISTAVALMVIYLRFRGGVRLPQIRWVGLPFFCSSSPAGAPSQAMRPVPPRRAYHSPNGVRFPLDVEPAGPIDP